MKNAGFHASLRGGRKVFAVSFIVAVVFASFAAVGAFAASATKQQNQSAPIGGDQFRDLRFDIDWFTHFKSEPGRIRNSADRAKMDQYLSQYALVLRAAEGLLAKGNNTSASSNSTNGQTATTNNQGTGLFNSRFWNDLTTQQKLAIYLHMLRGLRDKIESIAGSNTTDNKLTGTTMSSAGIPVTGSSGAGNQTSSSSNGNTTAQGSTTTSANQVNTSNALKLFGGIELRDLRFAIDWFTHFKSEPGKMTNASDRAKMGQYLDRYAAVLRAAEALVMRASSNTTGQAGTSSGQASNAASGQSSTSNNQATGFVGQFNSHWWNNLSLQQKLDVYLHMLRGLRDKILMGGAVNNTMAPH